MSDACRSRTAGDADSGRTSPAAPVRSGQSDPGRAETYLRLVAEAELRQRPVISGPGPHPHRVWLTAATLAAAGVIHPDVAGQVVSEFEISAGLRSGNVQPVITSLHRLHRPHRVGQHGAGQHPVSQHPVSQHGASPGGGSLQRGSLGSGGPEVPTAVPVGATLPLPAEREGWYGEFRLLSLARTEAQAALAVAARWAGQTRRAAGPRPRHVPYHQVGAVDDRGISYRASLWDMGIEGGRDWWDCHLALDPAPAPGTRWLEIGPGAQGQQVRIDLAAPPGAVQVMTEPVPLVSTAARLLDQVGDDLLGLEASEPQASGQLEARIAQIIQDLIGSGALRADDPPCCGSPAWAGVSASTWASAARSRRARCRPHGSACSPTPTPMTDPTRSRRSRPTCPRSAGAGSPWPDCDPPAAARHCTSWRPDWQPQIQGWLVHGASPEGEPLDLSLSWRARDSTGRWHLVSGMSWGMATQARGMIMMYLTPPLHPEATSLDVILSGPGCRIQATVPLDWGSGR